MVLALVDQHRTADRKVASSIVCWELGFLAFLYFFLTFLNFSYHETIITQVPVETEWFKALLLREIINENQKSQVCPNLSNLRSITQVPQRGASLGDGQDETYLYKKGV